MNIIVATEKNWGIGKDNDLLFTTRIKNCNKYNPS